METFGPIVYRWCRIGGVPESDASDLVQDVFTSVARNITSFQRQKEAGSFRCWLATITRNHVRDYFRKASRRAEAEGGTEAHRWMLSQIDRLDDSIDGDSIETPLLKSIVAAVQPEFESATWQAFWLTTVESQKPSLVAERLGISLASVYQAKSRVLKRLREQSRGVAELMDQSNRPGRLTIETVRERSPADLLAIREGMRRYNLQFVLHKTYEDVTLLLRDPAGDLESNTDGQ